MKQDVVLRPFKLGLVFTKFLSTRLPLARQIDNYAVIRTRYKQRSMTWMERVNSPVEGVVAQVDRRICDEITPRILAEKVSFSTDQVLSAGLSS